MPELPRFKLTKFTNYPAAYKSEFSKITHPIKSLLEIGVCEGGSMQYWSEMFPDAAIAGLDIDPRCKNAESERAKVFIGDQRDPVFLQSVLKSIPQPDIIIDDGSHWTSAQRASFKYLWPHLKEGGCYCVEDLGMFYSKKRMYGFRLGWWFSGFVKTAKNLVDALNGYHGTPQPLTGQIGSICFYDAMVFIHKRSYQKPEHITMGTVDCRKLEAGSNRPG